MSKKITTGCPNPKKFSTWRVRHHDRLSTWRSPRGSPCSMLDWNYSAESGSAAGRCEASRTRQEYRTAPRATTSRTSAAWFWRWSATCSPETYRPQVRRPAGRLRAGSIPKRAGPEPATNSSSPRSTTQSSPRNWFEEETVSSQCCANKACHTPMQPSWQLHSTGCCSTPCSGDSDLKLLTHNESSIDFDDRPRTRGTVGGFCQQSSCDCSVMIQCVAAGRMTTVPQSPLAYTTESSARSAVSERTSTLASALAPTAA